MNEKIFKVMNVTGAGNVAIGIILIVIGLAAGILSIISGVKLLKEKKNIIF
ncbi:MAG: hypothetical protein R3Y40_00445 [Eubacteriales bacterium]